MYVIKDSGKNLEILFKESIDGFINQTGNSFLNIIKPVIYNDPLKKKLYYIVPVNREKKPDDNGKIFKSKIRIFQIKYNK